MSAIDPFEWISFATTFWKILPWRKVKMIPDYNNQKGGVSYKWYFWVTTQTHDIALSRILIFTKINDVFISNEISNLSAVVIKQNDFILILSPINILPTSTKSNPWNPGCDNCQDIIYRPQSEFDVHSSSTGGMPQVRRRSSPYTSRSLLRDAVLQQFPLAC